MGEVNVVFILKLVFVILVTGTVILVFLEEGDSVLDGRCKKVDQRGTLLLLGLHDDTSHGVNDGAQGLFGVWEHLHDLANKFVTVLVSATFPITILLFGVEVVFEDFRKVVRHLFPLHPFTEEYAHP